MHSLPLRGHVCDCGYKHCAKFKTLLDFRCESCDKIQKQHFHTALQNATYSLKAIHNYLISCCAEAPIQEIVQEIRSDEVGKCLKREQMPLNLDNVDTGAKTQEKLKMFLHCDAGLIGNRICRYILLKGVK